MRCRGRRQPELQPTGSSLVNRAILVPAEGGTGWGLGTLERDASTAPQAPPTPGLGDCLLGRLGRGGGGGVERRVTSSWVLGAAVQCSSAAAAAPARITVCRHTGLFGCCSEQHEGATRSCRQHLLRVSVCPHPLFGECVFEEPRGTTDTRSLAPSRRKTAVLRMAVRPAPAPRLRSTL